MSEKTERSALTLRFVDSDLERRFQAAVGATIAPQFRLGLSVAVGLWIIAGFLLPRFSPTDAGRALTVAATMALANLVALGLSRRTATLDGQHAIGTAVNVLAGLAVLWLAVDAGVVERYAAPAMMLISIFAFVVLRLRFVAAAAAAVVYLAAFGAAVWANEPPAALVIDAFLLTSAVGSAVAATYFLEDAERDLFRQRERIAEQEAALRVEKTKSDLLLRNVLPDAIVRELQDNPQPIAHQFDSATIIFADLVGFTPLVEELPPEQTAAMLNELYSEFDDASRRHGVEKIKTIGDSYMAASGVPEGSRGHGDLSRRPSRVGATTPLGKGSSWWRTSVVNRALLFRSAASGIAGIAATAVADRLLDTLVSTEQKRRDRRLRPGRPHELAGPTFGAKLVGRDLGEREKRVAHALFTLAYALGWGAVYALARRRFPRASHYGGLPFAVPFFVACDAVIAPLLGLTPSAARVPWQMNAKELGNHAAWTAGAEAAHRVLEETSR